MIAFIDFLVNNYLWFLVISLILTFALIGYFVDQEEQKKGISKINVEKPVEKDIHELAASAGNKSLNTAVTDAVKNTNVYSNYNNAPVQEPASNTIIDVNSNQNTSTPLGFDVLKK